MEEGKSGPQTQKGRILQKGCLERSRALKRRKTAACREGARTPYPSSRNKPESALSLGQPPVPTPPRALRGVERAYEFLVAAVTNDHKQWFKTKGCFLTVLETGSLKEKLHRPCCL